MKKVLTLIVVSLLLFSLVSAKAGMTSRATENSDDEDNSGNQEQTQAQNQGDNGDSEDEEDNESELGESDEEFCGTSTYGSCETQNDCIRGGCSNQICQSVNEEEVITTCEYADCYNAEKYKAKCVCLENQCQWITKKTLTQAQLRNIIRERNKLKISTGECPEKCTCTGSVTKCQLERKPTINVEVSGDIGLSTEAQITLRELVASIKENEEKIEIEIKVKKENNEISVESEIGEGSIDASQEALLETLLGQLRELIENTEGDDIEIEIEIEYEFEREMTVVAGKSGNIIIQVKGINASTSVTLYKSEGKVYGVFKDNNTKMIRMLPNQVKERIREKLMSELEDEEIELDEGGVYRLRARQRVKLFSLIKLRERVRAEINSETGEILKLRRAWWSFLATNAEPPILGAGCGTVTPGYNNECCQNKGYDFWNEETGECEFNGGKTL